MKQLRILFLCAAMLAFAASPAQAARIRLPIISDNWLVSVLAIVAVLVIIYVIRRLLNTLWYKISDAAAAKINGDGGQFKE